MCFKITKSLITSLCASYMIFRITSDSIQLSSQCPAAFLKLINMFLAWKLACIRFSGEIFGIPLFHSLVASTSWKNPGRAEAHIKAAGKKGCVCVHFIFSFKEKTSVIIIETRWKGSILLSTRRAKPDYELVCD